MTILRHYATLVATIVIGVLISLIISLFYTLVLLAMQAGEYELGAQADAIEAVLMSLSTDSKRGIIINKTGRLQAFEKYSPDFWYIVRDGNNKISRGVDSRRNAADDPEAAPSAAQSKTIGSLQASAVFAGRRIDIVAGGTKYGFELATIMLFSDVNGFVIPVFLVMAATILVTLAAIPFIVARPIQRIALVADRIDGTREGARLPVDNAPRELLPMIAAFNRALQRIDNVVGGQRRFLSNAAHELRTPLTRINAYADRVRELETRNLITGEVRSLSSTVTMLLQLARLSSERAEIRRVNLVALIKRVTAEQIPTAWAAGVEIVFDAPGTSIEIDGVEQAIAVAFSNVLRNAIQASCSGQHISVIIHSPATVKVIDCGVGIDQAIADKACEPFVTGGKTDGHGLGLAIVAQVMTLHSGFLDIDANQAGKTIVSMRFSARTPA